MRDLQKLRVAVVGGAGVWGARYLSAYAHRTDCEIIALVDTAAERRKEFADHYGIPRNYATIEELLSDDVPDIVSASVPVSVAHSVITTCAASGVRVVSCEKPISNVLANADEMVEVCASNGIPFGCGTAMWEVRHLQEVCAWIQNGNIGDIIGASIPSGLVEQVSGTGCVPLNFLRFATGMEVSWVEGWTDPEEAALTSDDCTAYGTLGLSNGVSCRVSPPSDILQGKGTTVSIFGTNGTVWLSRGRAVLVQGVGDHAVPVYPDFMQTSEEEWSNSRFFDQRIGSLIQAYDAEANPPASGHDYRQVLEIAVAMKLSAKHGHKRIPLPLTDRNLTLNPRPWRLLGGDIAGWDEVGKTPTIVD